MTMAAPAPAAGAPLAPVERHAIDAARAARGLLRMTTPCPAHGSHVTWVVARDQPWGFADDLIQDLARRGLVAIDGDECRLTAEGARIAPAPPPAQPPRWAPPGRLI